MKIYDAHCHFDFTSKCLVNDGKDDARIAGICASACFENEWKSLSNLKRDSGVLLKAYGVHPASIAAKFPSWRSAKLLELRRYLENADAVGETGVDSRYFLDFTKEDQASFFSSQISLAREYSLPVIVHCVGAWGIVYESLARSIEEFKAPKFLIHAATCSGEMTERFEKLGGYFSFGKKNLAFSKTATCAQKASRVMLESDTNFCGDFTELEDSLSILSQIRGEDIDKLAAQTSKNFHEFYAKPFDKNSSSEDDNIENNGKIEV